MDVLIFARVSRDASGVARSLEEQIADCETWASREGWNVIQVIREIGSASEFSIRKNRPEWDQLLAQISSGRVGAILTWEHSRASRELAAYTALRRVCRAHNVKWGYNGKLYDLGDRSDRFRTGLDALLAEDESARTSERVRRAVRANAAAGLPHGRPLWGYRRNHDPSTRALVGVDADPNTAHFVQEAARRILDGESMASVAADFRSRAVPARSSSRTSPGSSDRWTGAAIKEMLANPSYTGLRAHGGRIIGEAVWPPLIDRAEWDALQKILFDPSRQITRSTERAGLLSGIARCGVEGCSAFVSLTTSSSQWNGRRYAYRSYVCMKGSHMAIREGTADSIVVERLLAYLGTDQAIPSLQAAQHPERQSELQALIARDEDWLAQVHERAMQEDLMHVYYDQHRLVAPRLLASRRELEQIQKLSPALTRLVSSTGMQRAWESTPDRVRRNVIRATMDIHFSPARPGKRGIDGAIERTGIRFKVS